MSNLQLWVFLLKLIVCIEFCLLKVAILQLEAYALRLKRIILPSVDFSFLILLRDIGNKISVSNFSRDRLSIIANSGSQNQALNLLRSFRLTA